MIHGSYEILNPELSYMIDGKCSKCYYWEFIIITTTNKYGYLLYRRRNNRTIIDNRWIVSYNLYLYQKYNCHINVKIYLSIRLIKYLYKYVYKGPDHIQSDLHIIT